MTNKWMIEAELMVRTDYSKSSKEEIIYYVISYANLLLLDITVYFSKVKRLYSIEIQIKLSTEHQIRIDKRFGIIPIRKGYQGCECLCTAYNKYPAVIEIFASSRKCVVNKSIIDITYYIDIASKYDK